MTKENSMTVLGEEVTPPVETPAAEPAQEQTKPFEQLVGEGKKYADQDALATAYTNADEHIATILQEKREVEEKLQIQEAQNRTTADLMAALKEDKPETPITPATPATPVQPDLTETVEQVLAKREATAKAAELKVKAWDVLAKEFGDKDKAKLAIAQYVGEDTAKVQMLDQLAITDVDAMIKILKPANQPAQELPAGPSQLMGQPVSSQGLTWSKCEVVRKENPRHYNSIEFSAAMHEAAGSNPDFMKT